MGKNRYIRFDWAAKYMLRRSAQGDACHSKNKADIKAKNSKGEIILGEIRQTKACDLTAEEIATL